MDVLVLVWFLLAAVAGLVLEFWAILTGRPTITATVRKAHRAYPPLGFLIGILGGGLLAHFFWQ